MRIGILSDTHGHVRRTARAVARLVAEGAEALIHCGDLTDVSVVDECGVLPCYFVYGNNDYDRAKLARAIAAIGGVCLGDGGVVELGGKRVAVTHGDSGREIRRLLELAPDYFLSGHTHATSDSREGPTRLINPGALSRASEWTVAVLDLETDTLNVLRIDDAS